MKKPPVGGKKKEQRRGRARVGRHEKKKGHGLHPGPPWGRQWWAWAQMGTSIILKTMMPCQEQTLICFILKIEFDTISIRLRGK